MKALVFTDLHLKPDSESTVFDEVLPGIARAASDHGVDHVFFLGDWYTLRYTVSLRLQDRCLDWFQSNSGIAFTMISGNHDQYDVEGNSALDVFNLCPNVTVHSSPTWDEYGLWVPYRYDKRELIEAIGVERPKGSPNVCYLHYGVEGAMKNDFVADEDGLPRAGFGQFEAVLCGHYHKRQRLGNVHYIGSPYQTRADESGQAKGYIVFDPDEASIQYVDTSWGPRFHRMDLESFSLDAVNERDEVRLKVPADADIRALASQLNERGIRHTITVEQAPREARLDVDDASPVSEYARAYVEQFAPDTGIEPDILMQAFREITQ